MESRNSYPETITSVEVAYELVEDAREFIGKLYHISENYRSITECFLNPDNAESMQNNLNFYEDEFGEELELDQVDHDELHKYLVRVSEAIGEKQHITDKLESIKFEELSSHKFVDGEKADLEYIEDQVDKLIKEYRAASNAIWNTDIRLKQNGQTNHNLIDMRINKTRREFKTSDNAEIDVNDSLKMLDEF